MARLRGRVRGSFERLPYLVAELDPSAAAALRSSPDVTSVVPDLPARPALRESTVIIGSDRARQNGWTGTGTTVAVLDTGVDAAHPFVAGRVAAEACFSAGGDCPGGVSRAEGPGSGRPCTYHPDCAHGTHVAGIVAGNAPDIRGVAPQAQIVSVQVFSEVDGEPWSWSSDRAAALEWLATRAAELNLAAVNVSIGSGVYTSHCDGLLPAEKAAIDELRLLGVPVVIAAGNAGSTVGISQPACISTAFSVGATTKADLVWSSSNTGDILDLLAPGASIVSSVPGGGFATMSGTSMAAPHVAGTIALLRQKSAFDPPRRLLQVIQTTGRSVSDVGGKSYPRIDADAALAALPGPYGESSFLDVPVSHEFHTPVEWMADEGLSVGYGDGTFGPDKSTSRGEFVAFLWRIAGTPRPSEDVTFSDVDPSHPFHDAIGWAAANGLVIGYSDGTFRPAAPVLRQEAVTVLWRWVGSPRPPFTDPLFDVDFTDVAPGHPFHDQVEWASWTEVAKGFADGRFRPSLAVTRKALSALLYRFVPLLQG